MCRTPEGQGLNDPYVRFFRMAERRIAKETGQGVVCFISNYSWLDGLSFTGMRERYLDAFDAIRIDCLNGDKYKTGKVAPDGSPDREHLFHGGRSGRHPSGHGHRHAGAQGGPRTRRSRRVPAFVGAGQARGVDRHGRRGTGRAVLRDRSVAALGPSVRGCGGEPRLVRLARAARPVPGFVFRALRRAATDSWWTPTSTASGTVLVNTSTRH